MKGVRYYEKMSVLKLGIFNNTHTFIKFIFHCYKIIWFLQTKSIRRFIVVEKWLITFWLKFCRQYNLFWILLFNYHCWVDAVRRPYACIRSWFKFRQKSTITLENPYIIIRTCYTLVNFTVQVLIFVFGRHVSSIRLGNNITAWHCTGPHTFACLARCINNVTTFMCPQSGTPVNFNKKSYIFL